MWIDKYRNLDKIIKKIREKTYDNELVDIYIREFQTGIKNMINFPIFIEGFLIPLLGLGVFVIYKRSKRKKSKFHVPPTHQLPS